MEQVGWLSPGGVWCDLIVRLKNLSSSSSSSSHKAHAGGSLGDAVPTPRSGEWLVLQLLGPADLANGPEPPGGWSSSSSSGGSSSCEAAVDQLVQQLSSSSCGCFAHGSSQLGHPKRSLMAYATGSAKRQLALLKGAGWRVAVVPFHELHPVSVQQQQQQEAGQAGDTESKRDVSSCDASACKQYVAAVLKEHCGDVGGLLVV
jgi:hypothetical protein